MWQTVTAAGLLRSTWRDAWKIMLESWKLLRPCICKVIFTSTCHSPYLGGGSITANLSLEHFEFCASYVFEAISLVVNNIVNNISHVSHGCRSHACTCSSRSGIPPPPCCNIIEQLKLLFLITTSTLKSLIKFCTSAGFEIVFTLVALR